MGLFDAIEISGSALSAERVRMDVTSENLANAQTTRTASGQPYQRQEVVLQQAGSGDFSATLAGAMGSQPAAAAAAKPGGGVQVAAIVADKTPDQLIYNPGSPDADAQGYVKMPNVNTVTEMTDLISESRAYQSSVTAMQTAKSMFNSTLSLLK
ncbi:MAG TPA: flagellar basal body rod protein FlgC [Solirubrobacteraceae bacterium]|nr:flagellar basal body rod protein FlgC [Solirubrobacteraceae bacterium]